MFFSVERSWVEAMACAKECKAPIGQSSLQELSAGICQQLRNVGGHRNCRSSNFKKDIHKGTGEGQNYANEPGAYGRHGHVWVIAVANDGTNFGIWRVVGYQGCFNLHFVDELFMLLRVVEYIVIF